MARRDTSSIVLYKSMSHTPGIYYTGGSGVILLAEVKLDWKGGRLVLDREFRAQHMKRFSLTLTGAQPHLTTIPMNFRHDLVETFDWISENCTGVWGLKSARRILTPEGNYLGFEIDFAFEHLTSAVMFKLMWG